MLTRLVPKVTLSLLLGLVACIVLIGAASSAGDDIGDLTAGLSPAELEDLKFFAEMDGTSLEVAIARYGWQDEFVDLIQEVRVAAPYTFAGAEIDDYRGVFSFVGEVPEEVHSVVKAFRQDNPGVGIDLHPNRGFKDKDVSRAVEAIHFALLGEPGVVDGLTSFDPDTDTIMAYVALSDAAPPITSLQSIAEARLRLAAGGKLADHVVVEVIKTPNATPILTLYSFTKHIGGERQIPFDG